MLSVIFEDASLFTLDNWALHHEIVEFYFARFSDIF